MAAATLDTQPVFLQFVTTEPGGTGTIVRVLAERETPGPGGELTFDRIVGGTRLTVAQAQMTGLTNTQLDDAAELDEVLQDLLEFSHGATHWVVASGAATRELLRAAALASGLPRFPAPAVIGLDELAGVVRPTELCNPGVPPGVSLPAEEKSAQTEALGSREPKTRPELTNNFKIRLGARLPHWTRTDGVYFVTFRLSDSLPKHVVEQWMAERESIRQKTANGLLSEDDAQRLRFLLTEKLDGYLDICAGGCELRNECVAEVVADAFKHFDLERYVLFAWSIMPNHVHVVFQPIGQHALDKIMHSWKSFTAKEVNKLLGTTGKFWEEEYYDHLVRSDEDFQRYVEYTYFNSEKSGIENWKFREVCNRDIQPGVPFVRAAVKGPRAGRPGYKELWHSLLAGLLKLPLPLLSEMNWLLAKTEHPLKKLLKAAETEAVKEQFSTTFNSGKISLDKLFKDFSEIINRLGPGPAPGADEEGSDVEIPIAPDDHPPEAPVTAEQIDAVLGRQGPLAQHLPGYEDRPEQLAMAKRVAAAMNEGKHLIAEAGTGIGKSLAYLVPSILFARRAGRPVMISTHTKNLQAQLYEKDLPFLRQHLGMDFEPALLKGRPNYLCLRKFMYTLQEAAAELDDDDRGRMLPVMTWATQTDTGDVTELAAFSREQNPELWDRLHTVGDDCLKRQCPFYKRCFVYKARGLTRTADVVVLNHSLVFSDLNVESGVLPPYNEIVFDEAHKLEDVATEHLACEVTPRRIYRVLNKLFRVAHGSAAGKGVLAALLANVEQGRSEIKAELIEQVRGHILAAMQAIQPANEGSDVFFDTVRGWTDRPDTDYNEPPPQVYVPMERGRTPAPDANPDDLSPPPEPAHFVPRRNRFPNRQPSDRRRFSAKSLRPDDVERFTEGKEAVIARLGRLRQTLTAIEDDFKEIKKSQIPRGRELLKEMSAQNLFLEELVHDIEFIIKGDEPNYVYWSEPLGKRGARVVAAPLDVSGLLHAQLYEKKRSIVLASATLSVRDSEADDGAGLMPIRMPKVVRASLPAQNEISSQAESLDGQGRPSYQEPPHPKSFAFVKTRIGLNLLAPEKLDELLLGSPFDYPNQSRLFVPTFLPEPGGAREKDFSAGFSAMVADLAIASGGRAMVLYTSYAALEASAKILRKALAAENIEVIAQGNDGSREALLARLKEGGRTVLLGTASFWEGVDVRGDALSLLIIAKLPFAVFTDPIVQGRCELLEANGKDPFLHFSIPQAILKLRQGFGRLIRAKTDRGVVILADKRVVTRRYGAAFLRALPAKARAVSSGAQLTLAVKEFLDQPQAETE